MKLNTETKIYTPMDTQLLISKTKIHTELKKVFSTNDVGQSGYLDTYLVSCRKLKSKSIKDET